MRKNKKKKPLYSPEIENNIDGLQSQIEDMAI